MLKKISVWYKLIIKKIFIYDGGECSQKEPGIKSRREPLS